MLKKLTVLSVVFILLFSVVGLTACDNSNDELADYKTQAIESLELYAESQGQDNYTAENWEIIKTIVENGKTTINTVDSKDAVDTAKTAAVQEIGGVSMIYNAVMFSQIKDWMNEDFLKENITRGSRYINDSDELVSADGESYPISITLIINKEAKFQEVFFGFPSEVNFEEQVLALYIFTATSGTQPYRIADVSMADLTLNIQYALDNTTETTSGNASAPVQRCIVVRINNNNVTSAEFTQK